MGVPTMQRMIFALAAVAMLLSATGCVSVFYAHETTKDGMTRREVGFLGLPALQNSTVVHGLLPLYIDTTKNDQ